MSADTYDERLALLEAQLREVRQAAGVEPRAAPLGFFQVQPGESILSDHMNTAVLQGIVPFASASARAAAIPTPTEGMLSYLLDLKRYERYTGTVWMMLIPPTYAGISLNGAAIANLPATDTRLTGLVGNAFGGATINNGLISVPVDGIYAISGRVARDSGTTAYWQQASIGDNNGPYSGWNDDFSVSRIATGAAAGGAGNTVCEVNVIRRCLATQQLGLWAGCQLANINCYAARLTVAYVGPYA